MELTRHSCHEPENLAMRYRKFNVSALLDAAVNAIDGAKYCKVFTLLQ